MPKESIIKHFSSSTTGNVPSSGDLVGGELAINTADEKIFFKNLAGNVVDLATSKGISGPLSSKFGIQYLTVNTAQTTVAKTTDETVTFVDGTIYMVNFVNGTSANSPTLNGVPIQLGRTAANTTILSITTAVVVPMIYVSSTNTLHLFGSHRASDSTEDATMRWTNTIQVGDTVTRVKLMMGGTDGKFYPISIGDSTSANAKTISTVEFRLNGSILYYSASTTLAPDALTASIYSEISIGGNFAYTANQVSGWTAYAPVYLKGTVNANGNFVLDNTTLTSFMTQTLPSSEDGFVYILFGYMYNTTTSFRLIAQHPIYEYKGGRIRQYVPNLQGDDITSGTIANVRTTATASNVNNAIVARDGSGNFSAGTITANLSGSATQLGGTAANSWALQSWVTTGLSSKANTTGNNASGTWPINITGNAATATTASSANQVANALTIGTGLGGAASYNGSSAVTISNTGVLSLNGLTGAVSVTGDGGALAGIGNNTIRARLASTSLTGVASFNSSRFAVSTAGQVDSLAVYSLNGLTGAVSMTGDGGALAGVSNNAIRARLATTSLTGVASFNSSRFAVNSAGQVDSLGVYSLNGLTGAVSMTGDGGALAGVGNNTVRARLATTSLTGVASFNSSRFAVNSAGQVDSLGVYSFNSLTGSVSYAPPFATPSVTGVASFSTSDFGVSSTGHVSLTGNVARTNILQTFTASQLFAAGLSGNLTGNATTATNATQLGGTGANSWALQSWVTSGLNGKANTTGNNASGTWPINITGNAATATTATTASSANQVTNALTIGTGLGGGASYNGSAAVTISNTGVLSLNGLTGARTLTGDGGALAGVGNDTIRARLASTSLTGVASFSSTNFDVSSGAVSIKTGGVPNIATSATSNNVVNAIVSRDGSGNFSAGTITASLAGNASTATSAATLTTARSINGTSFNGGSDITTANWGTSRTITIGDTGKSVNGSGNITWTAVEIGATSTNTANKIVMRDGSGNFSAGTITASLAGNASTATSAATLTTARSINGTSFNGGADITTANWGTSRTITVGNTGKSVNGSGNVSWSLSEIGAPAVNAVVGSVVVGGATLTGSVSLTAGSNITLTPSGSTITIASTASGGGGGVTTTAANTWTALQTFSAGISASGATFGSSRVSFGTYYINTETPSSSDQVSHIRMYESGSVLYGLGVSTNQLNIAANQNNGRIALFTNSTERMRVDPSGNVGIGLTNPSDRLQVSGSFSATTKSFVIPHPTVQGMTLRHGSLEGPENGVYVRGRAHGHTITLPHYWTGLVDEETITVQLTPFGKQQSLWVESVSIGSIGVSGCDDPSYFYTVYGERKDVARLKVEE